ncbi:MAG: GGDEF domain-containing protein [Mariprofundaceae bacterium]|nr:GGDEF domain-containing protein [Mariprofundaceae bacterium]
MDLDHPEPIHINCMATDVLKRFSDYEDIAALAVINDDMQVMGMVTRRKTLAVFGHKFSHDLNRGRSVEILMDSNPTSFDIATDINIISRSMTERHEACHFDPAIIIQDGIYSGLLSIITLLKSITDIRLQQAYDSNPLSRLPGNNSINREIDSRLQNKVDFMLVYVDIDSFKAYNDCYGYERGDRVIQMLVKILSQHVDKQGFLGHVGGDDFVLILQSDDWHDKLERVLSMFSAESTMMYRQEDRLRGHIVAEDRQGIEKTFALMSLSLAVVPCPPQSFTSHITVAEIASEVKHLAKNKLGNSIVINRRDYSDH